LPVVALVGLALVGWQAWLPTDYELNAKGLVRTTLGRVRVIPWRMIHRYEIRSSGILLYSRRRETPLDLLRGSFLPTDRQHGEIVSTVRHYLGEQSAPSC
jgi:hypothetical protein